MAESIPEKERQCSSAVDVLELPDCLRSHGMECYTTPHLPGFQATLKSRSEDFVVTEIDANGRLVQLDRFSPPPPPPPAAPPPLTSDPPAAEGNRKTKLRPDASEVPPLTELITEEHYKSLSELSDKTKTNLDPQLGDSVRLGEIPDKEKRSFIHNAVRLTFPVLQTKTVRSEAGISEIHVSSDPKFVPLCELLGAEEAERVLVFVSTSGKSMKLFLKPDPSREHRTKVHHKLSELYGLLLCTKSHTHQHGNGRKRRKLNDRSAESAAEDHPTRIVVMFRGSPSSKWKNGDEVYTKFSLRKINMESLEAVQRLSEVLSGKLSQFSTCGIKDKRAVTTQQVSVRGVTPQRLHSVATDPALSGITIGNYEHTDGHVVTGGHMGNHFKIVLRNVQSSHVTSSDDVITALIPQVMESVKDAGFINYFGPQRFGTSSYGPRRTTSFNGCLIGLAMLKQNYKAAVDMIISTVQDGNSDAIKEAKQYFLKTRDAAGTLEKMPHYQTRECYILKGLNQHGYSTSGCMSALMNIPHNWRNFYVHSLTSLLWNHLASFRVKEYGLRAVEGDLVLKKVNDSYKPLTARERVHVLTQQDIHTGEYDLEDVVLPLLGTSTVFPSNSVADKLKELVMMVGLTLASFRINAIKVHLPGTYRKLITYPKQLTWRWLPQEELAMPPLVRDREHVQKQENVEMSFSLESSCYATVLLREIMKQ